MVDTPYFDKATGAVRFDEMMSVLDGARAGDLILLHGCCHNPTGADLDADQWRAVAELVSSRGLVPYVDIAYQGLGNGLEADAEGRGWSSRRPNRRSSPRAATRISASIASAPGPCS
jgi:aromatic-amino-acid transaminase